MNIAEVFSQVDELLRSAQVRYFYWFLALAGSLVFLIQLALIFMGIGTGSDSDVNGDGNVAFGEHADTGFAEFKFFSLRAVFAFITFFGWGGVLWGDSGWSGFFGAGACGFTMMFLTALLIFGLLKLQQNGNIYAEDYINCTGIVYLTVPPERSGTGRVTVTVNGSRREIRAVADEELPTGCSVRIVEIRDGRSFVVEKLK
jgi:membrane protein implicated in regulation of membrane protease activity